MFSLHQDDGNAEKSAKPSDPNVKTLKEPDRLQWARVILERIDEDELPLSHILNKDHLQQWKG